MAYNRFRYYDPEEGRYISQDPIGLLSGEFGFYNYVEDTNGWIDVFGLAKSYSEKAKELGYTKTNYRSHGKPVYTNSKASRELRFISPDADTHLGVEGAWKGADSVKNLKNDKTRSGTYDADLNWIAK